MDSFLDDNMMIYMFNQDGIFFSFVIMSSTVMEWMHGHRRTDACSL